MASVLVQEGQDEVVSLCLFAPLIKSAEVGRGDTGPRFGDEQSIDGIGKEGNRIRDAAVISFNWDLVIDQALFGRGLNAGDYGF
jgi:hypothetical protein